MLVTCQKTNGRIHGDARAGEAFDWAATLAGSADVVHDDLAVFSPCI